MLGDDYYNYEMDEYKQTKNDWFESESILALLANDKIRPR